jgi:hypothetical protein
VLNKFSKLIPVKERTKNRQLSTRYPVNLNKEYRV